ncbi:hypothetical protein [Neobacillus sp. PS3-40]|uniref:hypothetical protein n=1 Tax=Neobacillus sp. PS3-40 TaxID=3070679 RepID=UPI0027DF0D66|nr:hypothetical protein [Neobacillus sp. PS3-40]WML45468.1 hypothetical protein RCG20_06075 [Neobacillus sp. PS3-40]
MSGVRKTILGSIIGIMVLGFLFFCFRVWVGMFNGDEFFIKWQLRRLIHNPVAFQSVSEDTSTIQFLEHLPKNPSISSIQEDLDHDNKVQHYQAKINKESVDLYVRDIGLVQTFSITRISVDGLPCLPEFFMD